VEILATAQKSGFKFAELIWSRASERRIGDFELREAVKKARGIELLVETEREIAASLRSLRVRFRARF
jgi:hypothetical protein